MAQVSLQNLYLAHDSIGISGARLYLDPAAAVYPPPANPPAADATSQKWGDANLDISKLTGGDHTLWVVPPNATDDVVGPLIATGNPPSRIYRGMRIQLTVQSQDKKVRMSSAVVHNTTRDSGTVVVNPAKQQLDVRLRPVWLTSPFKAGRKGTTDMIVVHRTGGMAISSAINQFLEGGTSAHYIVGRDGQIVKMVQDTMAAGHAGKDALTHWGTQASLNYRSIGIENVGDTHSGLEDAQYASLIRLITDLMTAYNIPRHRVIGHSEVLIDSNGAMDDDRRTCPGFQFDWSRLENASIGLARAGKSGGADPLAGFFAAVVGTTKVAIGPGDHDPQTVGKKTIPGRFGGKDWSAVTDTPIATLQTWLAEIGYSVGKATGEYNNRTAQAVLHFQTHFVGQGANTKVDQQTAALIRTVHEANPKAD